MYYSRNYWDGEVWRCRLEDIVTERRLSRLFAETWSHRGESHLSLDLSHRHQVIINKTQTTEHWVAVMHSVLTRAQNVFGFFTSVAFFVAGLIAVSVVLSPQAPTGSIQLRNVQV